jgi:hypothetical protein
VSGERSPLKGGAPGEVAWGDGLEGEGSGPRLSGLAPGSEGLEKSLGCKQWVAIGLCLLRFSFGRRDPLGAGT